MLSLPKWCDCGKVVTFSTEDRCEDCYARDQDRYTGKPTRVATAARSVREEASDRPSPLARDYDDYSRSKAG